MVFPGLLRGKPDDHRKDTPHDKKQGGAGGDIKGSHRMVIDPDHDLPEDKYKGRLGIRVILIR